MIKTSCEICGKEILNPKIRAGGHFICDGAKCKKDFRKIRNSEAKRRYFQKPEVKKRRNKYMREYNRKKKMEQLK